MKGYYILKGKTPVEVHNIIEWSMIYQLSNRVVKQDTIDGVLVSTVFLGLDYGFGMGPPLLFETMIFNEKHDGDTWRYSTWKQAEAGHKKACELILSEKN